MIFPHMLEIILEIVLSSLVMAVCSRLCGEWERSSKNVWQDSIGRIIFFGGGSAIVARITGAPIILALIFIPLGFNCMLVPPIKIFKFSNTELYELIIINLRIIIISLLSFTPLAVLLFMFGYFWPFLFLAATVMPLIYFIGKFVKINLWNLNSSQSFIEFMIGVNFGTFLALAMNFEFQPPFFHILNRSLW